MPIWLTIFLLALTGFAIWNCWHGFKNDRVRDRYGWVSKTDRPVTFYLYLGLSLFSSFAFPALILAFGILSLGAGR